MELPGNWHVGVTAGRQNECPATPGRKQNVRGQTKMRELRGGVHLPMFKMYQNKSAYVVGVSHAPPTQCT